MEPNRATPQQFSLASLRRRRAELRGAMNAFERALAAPVADDPDHWADSVHTALRELASDFREHVDITEGDDGLYAELRETAPRLSDAVARLAEEHIEIQRLIDDVQRLDDETGANRSLDRVRERGTVLLMRLVRHRQRGSDLVYDAYEVDIGGDT